jgi:hypothetical protein
MGVRRGCGESNLAIVAFLLKELNSFRRNLAHRRHFLSAALASHWRLLAGRNMDKTALDPFRVIVGAIASRQDSDLLVNLVSATGLRFDPSLSTAESYSNKTRLRALRPRIIAARDDLDDSAGLGVASTLVRALAVDESLLTTAAESLRRVGWDIQDGELIAVEPDVREMFFPKSSRWDAFVALRELVAEAASGLTIVDGYCDSTVFQLLAARADLLIGRSRCASCAGSPPLQCRVRPRPSVRSTPAGQSRCARLRTSTTGSSSSMATSACTSAHRSMVPGRRLSW